MGNILKVVCGMVLVLSLSVLAPVSTVNAAVITLADQESALVSSADTYVVDAVLSADNPMISIGLTVVSTVVSGIYEYAEIVITPPIDLLAVVTSGVDATGIGIISWPDYTLLAGSEVVIPVSSDYTLGLSEITYWITLALNDAGLAYVSTLPGGVLPVGELMVDASTITNTVSVSEPDPSLLLFLGIGLVALSRFRRSTKT